MKFYALLLSLTKETKEDRLKEVDPKLLFPIKAWLRGFLPGHKFHWDEENDLAVEDELEMKVDTMNLLKCPTILTSTLELVETCLTTLGSFSFTRRGAARFHFVSMLPSPLILFHSYNVLLRHEAGLAWYARSH